MTFSIERFKSAIGARNGIMRPNKFILSFAPPPCLVGAQLPQPPLLDYAIAEGDITPPIEVSAAGDIGPGAQTPPQRNVADILHDMEFWCEAINLPGYQLATQTTKRWTYGPDEKRPFAPIFQPIVATINADVDGDYLEFFNAWLQIIMPHDWYTGGINQITNYQGTGLPAARQYELAYKNTYATDLTIAALNSDGTVIRRYYIKEAFPSLVSDISMNWNETNSNAKFQVMFDYLDWTSSEVIV